MQEDDVHLNYIDETSNLFVTALSIMTRLDDLEAYDCNNNIDCTTFCQASENKIPVSQPPFALDLGNISNKQINDPRCSPIIATTNNQRYFNYERTSINNNTKMLRTSDNKVVVLLHNQSRIM